MISYWPKTTEIPAWLALPLQFAAGAVGGGVVVGSGGGLEFGAGLIGAAGLLEEESEVEVRLRVAGPDEDRRAELLLGGLGVIDVDEGGAEGIVHIGIAR